MRRQVIRSFSSLWVAGTLALSPAIARAEEPAQCDPRVTVCPPDKPWAADPDAPAMQGAPPTGAPMDDEVPGEPGSGKTVPAETAPPTVPPVGPPRPLYPNPNYPPPEYPYATQQPYAPQYPYPPQSPYADPNAPAWARPDYPTGHWRVEQQRRWGLFAAGVSVFGGLYMISALSAGVGGEWRMAIPIVGPWVEMAHYRERFDCSNPPVGTAFFCGTETDGDRMLYGVLVLDGLFQAGAVAMAAAGLLTRTQVKVWDTRVTVLPSVSPYMAGFTARANF